MRLALAMLLTLAAAPTARAAASLADGYRLLGVIACHPCEGGLQPIAVVEYVDSGASFVLRHGDRLGRDHWVHRIEVGRLTLRDSEGTLVVLETGGERSIYDDESQIIIARDPDAAARDYNEPQGLTP